MINISFYCWFIHKMIYQEEWHILLQEKKSTCHIDLPLGSKGSVNVILAYRATSWDACEHEATNYVNNKQNGEFLFWSSNPQPFGKNISLNCYIFRTCLVRNRVSLIHPGNTYTHNKGNGRLNVFFILYYNILR